jgi:signal transduction histidine kinase
LEKSGYEVRIAEDGGEGVSIAREVKPDIAFIDLKMPGMSGMEIIELLSREIPDIVLIMITGYATIISAVEAMQKGAYDYLPKPFSPDQLRALTRRGLDHRSLKIEARRLREEKERMERNFITFVSHEMRSPLVVVRQYIEALKLLTGDQLGREGQEIVERCCSRVQSLEKMVEHWLDISRIEEGAFAKKREPLRVAHLVAQSAEEMILVCREGGISLETEIPEDLPDICGDEEGLVRVFINLIGNAVKYTPPNGLIRIAAAGGEDRVTVLVSDTGSGIPADKVPFVFEPFFRAMGKEERHRGSGLGLTFCKKIMEAHGGEILVASREGAGTEFTLRFPLSRERG